MPEETDYRHQHWWDDRQAIHAAMQAAELPAARLDRFRQCGARAWVEINAETEKLRLRAQYCHDRHCLPCGQAKGLMIADNLVKAMCDDAKYIHGVLTTVHTSRPLAEQIKRFVACFKKLRQKRLWKEATDGGVMFLQMHPSERDGLWHVHGHFIARSRWLDAGELSKAWHAVTGDSTNVHVSAIPSGQTARDYKMSVAREVSRYVARPCSGDHPMTHEQLVELIIATKGVHMAIPFGKFRAWGITRKPEVDRTAIWIPVAPLADLIQRSYRGEAYATSILALLRSTCHPSTGPPPIGYQPSPPEAMPPTYWGENSEP